jgi:flagellar basal-body rod protein FlgB
MSEMMIFDRTIAVLGKALDLRHRQQTVLASNIANAETPGYKPQRLEFEADLRQALQAPAVPGNRAVNAGGRQAALARVEGRLQEAPDRAVRADENGVDLDRELIAQAENQLLYEAAAQMLSKKLGLLKYVSQDGR